MKDSIIALRPQQSGAWTAYAVAARRGKTLGTNSRNDRQSIHIATQCAHELVHCLWWHARLLENFYLERDYRKLHSCHRSGPSEAAFGKPSFSERVAWRANRQHSAHKGLSTTLRQICFNIGYFRTCQRNEHNPTWFHFQVEEMSRLRTLAQAWHSAYLIYTTDAQRNARRDRVS
jgi:hypothetical protein